MYNLCCISEELKEQGYHFQTMTWKRFNELCDKYGDSAALSELGERWLNNVRVTYMCIQHCYYEGWGYRVSSNLFPIRTHPDFKYGIKDVPQYDDIMDELDCIAMDNEDWNVRLSMHPDQFNVLASENQSAVDKTINELNFHGWVMDMLGCERSYYNPMNIHVNCTKGDPQDIVDRFMRNLDKCSESVRTRLVVENEDKGCWNVDNLLKYFDLPITYDNLHDKCNPSTKNTLTECAATWPCKPLFHYSESPPNKNNPRAHADLPVDIPQIDYYDWDIELKAKDKAIRACTAIADNNCLGVDK